MQNLDILHEIRKAMRALKRIEKRITKEERQARANYKKALEREEIKSYAQMKKGP